MNSPVRLHPVSIIMTTIKVLIRLVLISLAALFLGKDQEASLMSHEYAKFVIPMIIGLPILYGYLRWISFKFQVIDGDLQIDEGILIRKKRFIRKGRIQNIHVNKNLISRIFNTVQMNIETEGNSAEQNVVSLIAIRNDDAKTLQHLLLEKKEVNGYEGGEIKLDGLPESSEKKPEVKWHLSYKDLLLASFTSAGILPGIAGLSVIYSQMNKTILERLPINSLKDITNSSVNSILILLFLIIITAWIISVIRYIIKFGNFSVKKYEDQLEINYGLINKRQLIISYENIKAIRMTSTLLRQPLGYVSLHVEGSESATNSKDYSTILVPYLRKTKVLPFLRDFAPEFALDIPINPLPKKSMLRYIIRKLIPTIILVTVLCLLIPFGYFSITFIPLAILLGFMQYKDSGWGTWEKYLLFKSRVINLNTLIIPRRHIRALESRQSYFQRRLKLATLRISILSNTSAKRFGMKDVLYQDINKLESWFSYAKGNNKEDI